MEIEERAIPAVPDLMMEALKASVEAAKRKGKGRQAPKGRQAR